MRRRDTVENSLEFVLELQRASGSSDLCSFIRRSRDHSVWVKSDVYLRTICSDVQIHGIKKQTNKNQFSELINYALAVMVPLYTLLD